MFTRAWLRLIPLVLSVGCGEVHAVDDETDASAAPSPDATPSPADGAVDGAPATCVPPPAGLFRWWRGENTADDFRRGNDGTLAGAVGFAGGVVGRGFVFGAAGGHVDIAHTGELYPAGSFALEVWIKPALIDSSVQATPQVLINAYECGRSCEGKSWFGLQIAGGTPGPPAVGGGHVSFVVRDAADRMQWLTSTRRPTQQQAAHVVAVRNVENNTLALYLDGELQIEALLKATGPLAVGGDTTDDPLTLGAGINTGVLEPTSHFKGVLDEVSLYHRSLSEADVKRLYAAGSLGKCATQ